MKEKKEILSLLNSKDIRCIGNSEDVIFVESINDYCGIDNKNYCDGINVIINSKNIQDDISQLYCILKCGCYRNLEDYYPEKHFYDDIDTFYELAKKEMRSKPKELIYYWYHHGMINKNRQAISKAIQEHDFETFISFYKKYNSKGILNGYRETEEFDAFFPIIYLPDTASFINEDNEIDYLNILKRDNFNRIIYNENECG